MAEVALTPQAELQEFLQTRIERRRLLPRAVAVGVAAGAVASLFRMALTLAEKGEQGLIARFAGQPWVAFAVMALIGAVGTLLAYWIGGLDPDSGGSGIPQMKAVLEGHLKLNWSRIVWVKFVGALASIGSGLALGREGPTVQMGGALGHGLATITKANSREVRALTAAGSGAGLAAAFNAPLAGVTFVLEELQRDFQPAVFVATLLSAAVATAVSRFASGSAPVFAVPNIPEPGLRSIPLFAVVGLLTGFMGIAYNRALVKSSDLMALVRGKSLILMAVITGVTLAACAWFSPLLLGSGHALSEQVIAGSFGLITVLGLFMARFVAIHVSYSTGVPGGLFAPLLSLGALLGLLAFRCTVALHLNPGMTLAACAVAGMCGLFSSVVRAPLTGVILIGEMTGSYGLLLPLLVTAFTAFSVAEGLKDMPIYEVLLQRLAMKRGFSFIPEERLFAECVIEPGSSLVGKHVREAGFKPGTLAVLCTLHGKTFIPSADTILKEDMKIAFVAATSEVLTEAVQLARAQEGH